MIIRRMTATFGKLEGQTLTFHEGLNIVQAPNEWGKSTWCAFLIAMLYGIDTRERTTQTALSAKEHYTPWSGSPMSGAIALCVDGREITIERSSTARTPLCNFRAYETESGLEIPELTAENCGQMLLGVEKSVFARAGFLKSSDLPITQDDALRKRLNALVTTGDESGSAEKLASKLRDLKNRVRANATHGLLPEAIAERNTIADKLQELLSLQSQSERVRQELSELGKNAAKLKNHLDTLAYTRATEARARMEAAQSALYTARTQLAAQEAQCAFLASEEQLENELSQVQALREERDALQIELSLLPPSPTAPQIPDVFRAVTPEQAQADETLYGLYSAKRAFPWYFLPIPLLGAAAFAIPHWVRFPLGAGLIAAGAVLFGMYFAKKKRRSDAAQALCMKYAPIPPTQWASSAQSFASQNAAYIQATDALREKRASLEARAAEQQEKQQLLTHGAPLSGYEAQLRESLEKRRQLALARTELTRAEQVERAIREAQASVPKPETEDALTLTEAQTRDALAACEASAAELRMKLGVFQGKADALGHEPTLTAALARKDEEIAELQNTYEAVLIAQETLTRAAAELQRRFAPRIAQRAQEILSRLTGGRYDRLQLGEDLSVSAGAQDENTAHGALWRSAGTVDQLYLAVRLAVAQELTPRAPLVLDDALVRFDDTRLGAAMQILRQTAQEKQVLLFTCQSREKAYPEE